MIRPIKTALRQTQILYSDRLLIDAIRFHINSRNLVPQFINRRNHHAVTPCRAYGVHTLFAGCTIYVIPFYIMMICYPKSNHTKRILTSSNVFIPIALAYAYLLVASWEKDTLQLMMPGEWKQGFRGFNPQFFPKLNSIKILFSRLTTAASLWVHILAVNFFFARHVYLDGLIKRIPTRHSCFIATFLGPMAIISAILTEILWKSIHEHKGSHKHRH